MIHQINIAIHVLAGTMGIIIGLVAISSYKRTVRHKQFGRYFLWLLSVVVTTGFLGWLFYRQNPFLLMLTLLSGYAGYAGYRAVQLRELKASSRDAAISMFALAIGVLYLIWLQQSRGTWSPMIIYSTLGALLLVTVYDLIKFFWLHDRIKKWWLYEHIYKMISALSALLSAFAGTVLPNFKPFSQIGPSTLGVCAIAFFIVQRVRENKALSKKNPTLVE